MIRITQLEKRIACLATQANTFILAHPTLARPFALLLTVKGIGETSAIALLGELMLLPAGLTHKQWVKCAGLDPRHFKSGTSVDKRACISKAGNRYIRQALYMPALSAKAHDPHVKGFFEHLIANGNHLAELMRVRTQPLKHLAAASDPVMPGAASRISGIVGPASHVAQLLPTRCVGHPVRRKGDRGQHGADGGGSGSARWHTGADGQYRTDTQRCFHRIKGCVTGGVCALKYHCLFPWVAVVKGNQRWLNARIF